MVRYHRERHAWHRRPRFEHSQPVRGIAVDSDAACLLAEDAVALASRLPLCIRTGLRVFPRHKTAGNDPLSELWARCPARRRDCCDEGPVGTGAGQGWQEAEKTWAAASICSGGLVHGLLPTQKRHLPFSATTSISKSSWVSGCSRLNWPMRQPKMSTLANPAACNSQRISAGV
jgi:hypothetical protein